MRNTGGGPLRRTLFIVATVGVAIMGCFVAPINIDAAGADTVYGTVVVVNGEVSGSFPTGFCAAPGDPVWGGCSGGGALFGLQTLAAGVSSPIALPAGEYNAAMGDFATTSVGVIGPV